MVWERYRRGMDGERWQVVGPMQWSLLPTAVGGAATLTPHAPQCVGTLCPSKSVPPHPLWPCVIGAPCSDGTACFTPLHLKALPACSIRCSNPDEERQGRKTPPLPKTKIIFPVDSKNIWLPPPFPSLSSSLFLCATFSLLMRATPAFHSLLNP